MKPNILIIEIDSLPWRKCFGSDVSAKIPNIKSLAENGVNFDAAISSSDGTELSWASLFTGLYPFRTGLNGNEFRKISKNVKNFFELFIQNGYYSCATIPYGSKLFGLSEGFQNNDSEYRSELRLFKNLNKTIMNTLQNLDKNSPWIYFIHLLDLHTPIILPDEFNHEKFGNTDYDRMLSAIDYWVGEVLKKIEKNNTIIIFTADHGEYISDKSIKYNFSVSSKNKILSKIAWKIEDRTPKILIPIRNRIYDKIRKSSRNNKERKIKEKNMSEFEKRSILYTRMDEYGFLYDDLVHVPLIISGFGMPKKKISQIVRHVDVFPTIAEILGIKVDFHVDGRSIFSILKDKEIDDIPAYFEGIIRTKDPNNAVVGIRTLKYKYFRSRQNSENRVFLFDLETDPFEEENISHKKEIIKELEIKLSKIRENEINENDIQKMTDSEKAEVENELRKLGYI